MRRGLAVVALAAALLAGCGGDGSGITFKDPKGTIDVERGMEFTFEFSVNASVGYDWEAVGPAAARHVELTETDVHYENPDAAGDSGVKRFRLKAGDTAGQDELVFRKLFRGDQEERRSITVEVR